jgi:cytochrome c-type biogenesis protein
MIVTLALAFLAGLLSILSPCVLPLVPIVLGAAISEHRLGPVALAAGLAVSFTVLGLMLAVAGFAVGIDADALRITAAAVMIGLGIVLMLPAFQLRLATAAGPVANWAEQRFGGFSTSGLGGQFAVGLLLGAVWSPCVGPTLGAASLLASQGRDLGQVGATMAAFGFGAGLPLALLGFASRAWLARMRDRMLAAGTQGKLALGVLFVGVGLSIVTGLDKRIETALVEASPAWLTELTTRF